MTSQFIGTIKTGTIPEIEEIEKNFENTRFNCKTPVVLGDTSTLLGLDQKYSTRYDTHHGAAWKVIEYLSREFDNGGQNYVVLFTPSIFDELTKKNRSLELSTATYECIEKLFSVSGEFIKKKTEKIEENHLRDIEDRVREAYHNGMGKKGLKSQLRKLIRSYMSEPDFELLVTGIALEKSGTCEVVICSADYHHFVTINELKRGHYFGNQNKSLSHLNYIHTKS